MSAALNQAQEAEQPHSHSDVACIFPSLTDGHPYKEPSSKFEPQFQVLVIEHVPTDRRETYGSSGSIGLQELFIATWAMVLALYVGIENTSFYVATEQESGLKYSLWNVAVPRSTIKKEFLNRIARLIRIHESPDDHGKSLKETVSARVANTAVLLTTNTSHDAPVFNKEQDILVLRIVQSARHSDISLLYQLTMISKAQASNIATTFSEILASLQEDSHQILADISYLSERHVRQVFAFNKDIARSTFECFHDIVERHSKSQPQALAVDSWDGKLNYADLFKSSTRLAKYLQVCRIRPGDLVPICFERSALAIVAMLAVSISGGAFISLPPNLPSGRRDALTKLINPPVVITTSSFGHLWSSVCHYVAIDDDRINHLPQGVEKIAPAAQPDDIFYAVSTSGSTGNPKCAMVSHSSFFNGALRNAPQWHIGPESRVLQMLSHTFDMSLLEICTTLGSGGCVCVPSDEEIEGRNVSKAIKKHRVSVAIMTSSLSRLLNPEESTGLRTLCLGGEPISQETVDKWCERLELIQFYGPCECSINTTYNNRFSRQTSNPSNIGIPNSGGCWVVSPEDHNRLLPVGAIGELLVSGPIVGLGYYKEPQKTAQAFLDDVAFLKDDTMHSRHAIYKTGDLVRWNSDGTLLFCGRKDSQEKINGQRLELGEVEYHLTRSEDIKFGMAMVPKTGRCQRNLVAVVALNSVKDNSLQTGSMSLCPKPYSRSIVKSLRSILEDTLPRYMVPTMWAFLEEMPLLSSGKIDRVNIRRWIENISDENFQKLTEYLSYATNNCDPMTELEIDIQSVWADILNLQPEEIGPHQSFIKLGGDSILAQEVIAACREKGIRLNMEQLLTCEGIRAVARLSKAVVIRGSTNDAPLALDTEPLWNQLGKNYNLAAIGVTEMCEIEDVYPCTALQVGMFLGQIRKPSSYHLRFFYKCSTKDGDGLDVSKCRAAWNSIVERHAALRTVFVDNLAPDHPYHAIVLRRPRVELCFIDAPSEPLSCKAASVFPSSGNHFPDNSPPHRLTLAISNNTAKYFMIEISHAIMDGAAWEILLREFTIAYEQKANPYSAPDYRDFVAYENSCNTAESANYWLSYMKGCQPCIIPVDQATIDHSAPNEPCRTDVEYDRGDELLSMCRSRQLTVASAMRVAWALVLRTYTGSNDVCFAYFSGGRDVPVRNVNQMIGLCLSAQPCRVKIFPDSTVVSLSKAIQQDYVQSLRHHHYPIAELKARLYTKGSETLFNNGLSMEWTPKADPDSASSISLTEIIEQDDPSEHDIGISVHIFGSRIKLGFLFWSSVTDSEISGLANSFKKSLDYFIDFADAPVSSLSLVDEIDILTPGTVDLSPLPAEQTSVLYCIEEKANLQPMNEAVLSWDGTFLYGELRKIVRLLAIQLHNSGVRKGDRVIGCFNKSRWSIAMILAIMRSGAAFVASNPKQPQGRLRSIADHCAAKFIVSEGQYAGIFETTAAKVLTFESFVGKNAQVPEDVQLPMLNDADVAIIVYTSGSTGNPKGIVIDHGSLATSILKGHGVSFGFSCATRAFQFSDFIFDGTWCEVLTTLAYGGCICVPSEKERMSDLAASINRMGANWAQLTPTVARLIKPQDVSCLKSLVLCGEAVSREDIETWADHVQLFNAYGPAEATICVTVNGPLTSEDNPTCMGVPVGGTRIWIVEIADQNRLAPTGCIGELVVESRQVTQGYLDDTERTSTSFTKPSWLDRLTGSHRVFKTGDMARRGHDGKLYFMGRKDTQVKIRGQRVELAEVEQNMRFVLPELQSVVAEVINLAGDENPTLAAFLVSYKHSTLEEIPVYQGCSVALEPVLIPKDIVKQLEEKVPCYMVPAVYFLLNDIPTTATGKIERKKLKEAGSAYSLQNLAEAYSRSSQGKQRSLSRTEQKIQRLCSEALNVDCKLVGLQNSFFRLGGDSVTAMKLVMLCRRDGVNLTVADIFRNPNVEDLAQVSQAQSTGEPASIIKTFSAIEKEELSIITERLKSSAIPCDVSDIEDILPATDIQTFYLDLAAKSSLETFHYLYLDLGPSIDLNRLKRACLTITNHFSVLRTIFTLECFKFWQIILPKLDPAFVVLETTEELDSASDRFCFENMKKEVKLESPFLSFTVISHQTGSCRLIMRLSHAQFDGASLKFLLSSLREAYMGQHLSATTSFSAHVYNGLQQTADAQKYWHKLLQGYVHHSLTENLEKRVVQDTNNSRCHVTRTISMPKTAPETTIATIVCTAWGLTLALFTGKQDVLYGYVVAGRNSSESQDIVGPCFNTVPVRVRVPRVWTKDNLLQQVQSQYVSMVNSTSLGYQTILKNCAGWSLDTVEHEDHRPHQVIYDSMIQYHDIEEEIPIDFDDSGHSTRLKWCNKPYKVPSKLEISVRPKNFSLEISITGDSVLLDERAASEILDIFSDSIASLSDNQLSSSKTDDSYFNVSSRLKRRAIGSHLAMMMMRQWLGGLVLA